ncbi:hypothetical protein EPJ80_06890 [Brachyspira aalborgi]|uniref:Uncharacterized protein n=1 Tax=Brachyspira aalborgi TaxID=29522 RepID=A0A5C8CCY0_9SPIR|nr:hypothetical protein EPJ80_06890 [Brachyspira aalborgi]
MKALEWEWVLVLILQIWKKTTKDGKDIKLESVDATDAWGWGNKNISIVYYYDTQTLHITYDTALHGNGYSFIGTKQP